MKKFILALSFTILILVMGPLAASAAILYGHAGFESNDADLGRLYRINTVTQTVTEVGTDPLRESSGPEIQINPSGNTIYMSQAGSERSDDMLLINPSTGMNTGTLSLSGFPGNTNTATAMEFVGNTLYAAFHQGGPEAPDGILGTINTTTGAITEIGPMTNMNRPTGGLAYVNGTMYAVSATDNNDSRLFTINLSTGAATLVGNLTLDSTQQQSATALTYADGKLYTVLYGESTDLYSINPATGELTVEFDSGVLVNSLTTVQETSPKSIPTLNEWGMIVFSLLMGSAAIFIMRKQKLAA